MNIKQLNRLYVTAVIYVWKVRALEYMAIRLYIDQPFLSMSRE